MSGDILCTISTFPGTEAESKGEDWDSPCPVCNAYVPELKEKQGEKKGRISETILIHGHFFLPF